MVMNFLGKDNLLRYFRLQTIVMNLIIQVKILKLASMMVIDEKLKCSFKILRPVEARRNL